MQVTIIGPKTINKFIFLSDVTRDFDPIKTEVDKMYLLNHNFNDHFKFDHIFRLFYLLKVIAMRVDLRVGAD